MTCEMDNTTLRLETKIGICDYPCCSNTRPWVDRQEADTSSVGGLEDVLDKIDQIFSVIPIISRYRSKILTIIGNYSGTAALLVVPHHRYLSHDSTGYQWLRLSVHLDTLATKHATQLRGSVLLHQQIQTPLSNN